MQNPFKWIKISWIFYLVLIILWEIACRLQIWPRFLFPSPIDVSQTLVSGFSDGTFLIATWSSLQRITIGYAISLFSGVFLGILIGHVKLLDETIGSLLGMLQVLPSICWLPLAILWFGLSETAIQFVVVMGALLPIAIATDSGIKNIPPIYMRAAKTMGIKGPSLYARVTLPASLPAIVTGMKLGWSFAWRSLMAGELIFVSLGLGQLLQMGRELHDMSQVMASMFIIMMIGLTFNHLFFAPIETTVRKRWGTA